MTIQDTLADAISEIERLRHSLAIAREALRTIAISQGALGHAASGQIDINDYRYLGQMAEQAIAKMDSEI